MSTTTGTRPMRSRRRAPPSPRCRPQEPAASGTTRRAPVPRTQPKTNPPAPRDPRRTPRARAPNAPGRRARSAEARRFAPRRAASRVVRRPRQARGAGHRPAPRAGSARGRARRPAPRPRSRRSPSYCSSPSRRAVPAASSRWALATAFHRLDRRGPRPCVALRVLGHRDLRGGCLAGRRGEIFPAIPIPPGLAISSVPFLAVDEGLDLLVEETSRTPGAGRVKQRGDRSEVRSSSR